jgi:hypothetical protein
MDTNKILILICSCFILSFCVYACIFSICVRSYFFDLWKIVPSVFSFPTLLARVTYMSYGGGGGRSQTD